MKLNNDINPMQKQVCISYDSMEELLNRQEHMTNTLTGYLQRNNNIQYIKDTVISMTADKYQLTFTLAVSEV